MSHGPSPAQTIDLAPASRNQPRSGTLRSCLILIGLLIVIVAAVEAGSRVAVTKISRIERRTEAEYAAVHAPPKTGKPMVLFLGNSLLDAAVQVPRLRQSLEDSFEIRRFMVEQTHYYDWFYGIRRLLQEGVRPDVVVLMLSGHQLLGTISRGDYSAYHLVAHRDIVRMTVDLQLHPTEAAGMVLSNYSFFYGLRKEIRKVLLGRLIADFPTLSRRMLPDPAPPIPEDRLIAGSRERIAALQRECANYGVRLVFAVPPAPDFRSAALITQGATQAGVEILVPFSSADFSHRDFSDGFHMNERGAEKYTALLIARLQELAPAWISR